MKHIRDLSYNTDLAYRKLNYLDFDIINVLYLVSVFTTLSYILSMILTLYFI